MLVTREGATYTYSVFGRLATAAKAGTTTTYAINALGQRVHKQVGAGTNQWFTYGPGGLQAEHNGSWTQYVRLPDGSPIALVRGGQISYIHTDHLSRPEIVTNGAKAITWRAANYAFGRTVTLDSIGGLNLGFPGQYYDGETSLWYNHHRTYNPRTGRYLESDPIGLAGGLKTYAYVDGNPVNLVDELGLQGRRPNSWNRFQQQAGGRGLTQSQILSIYRQTQLQNMGWNRPLQRALDNFPGPTPTLDMSTAKCDINGYCTVVVNTCTCANETMTTCPAKKEPAVGPMPQDNPACYCKNSIMPINI